MPRQLCFSTHLLGNNIFFIEGFCARKSLYITKNFSNWLWSWPEALLQVLLASRQRHGKGHKCNLPKNLKNPLCQGPLQNAWSKSLVPSLFEHHRTCAIVRGQRMFDFHHFHQPAEGTKPLVHFLQDLTTCYPG